LSFPETFPGGRSGVMLMVLEQMIDRLHFRAMRRSGALLLYILFWKITAGQISNDFLQKIRPVVYYCHSRRDFRKPKKTTPNQPCQSVLR
jgi:hypothetical protein